MNIFVNLFVNPVYIESNFFICDILSQQNTKANIQIRNIKMDLPPKLHSIIIHQISNEKVQDIKVLIQCPKNPKSDKSTTIKKLYSYLITFSRKNKYNVQSFRTPELRIFSEMKDDLIIYLIADLEYKDRMGSTVLEEIKRSDKTKKSVKSILKAYEYSSKNDKIAKAQQELDNVKMILLEDIDKVLANANDTDILFSSTSALRVDSADFRKKTRKNRFLTFLQSLIPSS